MKTFLGRNKFTRAVSVCGIAAAATVLVAGNAYADTVCATFTLAQPNWRAGGPGPHSWNSSAIILNFQSDGNLVIYLRNSNGTEGAAVWASGTSENELTAAGQGANPVTQLDWSAAGDIVLVDGNGGGVCIIGGGALAPGGTAVLQNDGNFVFYNTSHAATWAISGGFHDYGTDYCEATGQL